MQISKELARFTNLCQFKDLSENVIHETKRSILNYFAVCIAAYNDPAISKAFKLFRTYSGKPQSTIFGFQEKLDVLQACSLNAMAANVFDFDDTHLPTIIHPTAPVISPLLALSEQQIVSGQDLLLSAILGMEFECRLGQAISPFHYSRGWHITSTCGVIGAAIGSGKLLQLNQQQLLWAIGNAATQACGLVENLGTMSKSMSVGNAAKNGLLSALLAANDFDGPMEPLEGERGFLNVFGQEAQGQLIIDRLGVHWELLNNTYKPFPCGVVLNPVIEACLQVYHERSSHPDFLGSIQKIQIVGNPLLKQRTDRPHIQTGRQSQVSGQHAVAVALHFGQAGIKEFSDHMVQHHQIQSFYSKIEFVEDSQTPVEGVKINFITTDQSFSVVIDAAKGSLARPLSDKDLENKFVNQLALHQLEMPTDQLFDGIWNLEKISDVSQIIRWMPINPV
jgi:2-methylcitrate dehydratase PrpD